MIRSASTPTTGEARRHTGGHYCGFVLFAELSLADERAPKHCGRQRAEGSRWTCRKSSSLT